MADASFHHAFTGLVLPCRVTALPIMVSAHNCGTGPEGFHPADRVPL